jgi:ACS family sodium-dependent inorganic phosphate cotransporter-like MFS transporter 5
VYQDEWREVFLIAAEIYLFGCAVYVILGDGEKQWWADGVTKRKTKADGLIPTQQKPPEESVQTENEKLIT